MSEGQQDKLDYVYALLREFDNYGSDDVAVCAREVLRTVSDLRQRETELQARMTAMQNEVRMWKARATAKQKLLDALLLLWSNRWGYDGDAAQDLIRQVSKRNDELEIDVWCGAVNEVRAFVKDAAERLEVQERESSFLQRWIDRFQALLSRA